MAAFTASYRQSMSGFPAEYNMNPPEESHILCAECSEELIGDEPVFCVDGEWVCSDCAWELLTANHLQEEILERFFTMKEARDI